jgi:TatD DNase family protein
MDACREAALSRARAAGIAGLLLAGVDLAGWHDEAKLAASQVAGAIDIALSFGVHPQIVPALEDAALTTQLEALAAALSQRSATGPGLPRPHAVGELGLDGLSDACRAALPRQERAFRAQLALARQHDLPIVLHILRSHGEALRILKADGVPRRGGVVHSYSGSAELVPEYLSLGLSISFAGAVTYPNARRIAAAARAVPIERLLVETDAPDQTPWARRPGGNEPAFLVEIIGALAMIREEPTERLAAATSENARRLFGLPTG